MRAIQKLCRSGSSTVFTVPRPILERVGWVSGDFIVVELLENGVIQVRTPTTADFRPRVAPTATDDTSAAVPA